MPDVEISKSVGTMHGLEEFAAMLMKPASAEDDVDKELLEVGKDQVKATRGTNSALDRTGSAIRDLANRGVPLRFADV